MDVIIVPSWKLTAKLLQASLSFFDPINLEDINFSIHKNLLLFIFLFETYKILGSDYSTEERIIILAHDIDNSKYSLNHFDHNAMNISSKKHTHRKAGRGERWGVGVCVCVHTHACIEVI